MVVVVIIVGVVVFKVKAVDVFLFLCRWLLVCVCCWYYCVVVGLLVACLLSRAVLQREEERVKW